MTKVSSSGPRGIDRSRISRVRQPQHDELDGARRKPGIFEGEGPERIVDALQSGVGDSPELFAIQPPHPSFGELGSSACPGRLVDEGRHALGHISSAQPLVHGHVADDGKRVRPQDTKLDAPGRDVSFGAEHGISPHGPGRTALASAASVPCGRLRVVAAAAVPPAHAEAGRQLRELVPRNRGLPVPIRSKRCSTASY